ncbi:MAG: tetratricopeptide repeat protein [Chloroflexota bacterium]
MRFQPILAKIQVPPRPAEILSRPRLLDFLHQSADMRLVAISAPAGYGKTTLLVDFAHRSEISICWYTLDRFDREPGTFFAYLLSAIQRQCPEFGSKSQAVLAALPNPARDWASLAAMVVNELYEAVPDYFSIVLDDYHHVEDVRAINDFLAYLLQYSDEHCHLIIASRRFPHLPNQALLFGRGQMTGLDAYSLRFSTDEAQSLVAQSFGSVLSAERVAELTDQCEGWVTAILMAARSEKGAPLGESTWGSASEYMYGYLAEQVFDDQPPELRSFLLESAVLERMSAEALDALRESADSARMLAQVGARSLFLAPLDEEQGWHRYHQLFREYLLDRLYREDRARLRALHCRAGAFWESKQKWAEAFEHYTLAFETQAMLRLFEAQARDLFTSGQWDTLRCWLNALPAELAQTNPHVIYFQALLLMEEQGDPGSALSAAGQAHQGFVEAGDVSGGAWALMLQATALRFLGRYTEALETCQRALSEASRLDDAELLAEVRRTLGITYYYEGRIERATESLEEALQQCLSLGRPFRAARVHHELGIAYRALGQWRQAVSHYRRANRIWERLNSLGSWSATLNSLGVVHHLRGDYAQAYQLFHQALEKAQRVGYRRMEAVILSSLGDLYRDTGQYREALEAFRRSMDLADEVSEGAISVYARQGLGEICRLAGDWSQAIVWLAEAMEKAKVHGSTFEIGLCELSRGVLWKSQGRQAQSWLSLGQAKEFFEQSGHLHELARAHFHLAHLAYFQGRRHDVVRHLGLVADLCWQLGYDDFLVAEGRQLGPFLTYAASVDDRSGWWARILERSEEQPSPPGHAKRQEKPRRPPLRIFALGQDRVLLGGEEARTGRPKVRELFYYLLLHCERGVHREQIMADFWPDATPANAVLSLKSALYRLRRLYTDVRQEEGYYVADLPAGSWYDVRVFEQLIDEAQAARDSRAKIEAYQKALELYKGDFLAEYDAPWCATERHHLQERYRRAVHALAELRLSQGEYGESQDLYRRALEVDEFDEAACRGLLYSYAGTSQRSQALAFYHQFAQHLYDEMGITPTQETEAVYLELLSQDES